MIFNHISTKIDLKIDHLGGDKAHIEIAQCCLSDHEVRGFIAEIVSTEGSRKFSFFFRVKIDLNVKLFENLVKLIQILHFFTGDEHDTMSKKMNFIEHVRHWIPTIFELRKARYYTMLFEAHAREEIKLVDLSHLEMEFPLDPRPHHMPHHHLESGGSYHGSKQSSRQRRRSLGTNDGSGSKPRISGQLATRESGSRRASRVNRGSIGGNSPIARRTSSNDQLGTGTRGSVNRAPKHAQAKGMPKRRASAKLCRKDTKDMPIGKERSGSLC